MTSARSRGPGLADVNGALLYYEVAGDGPPLVLIHAGIADCRMWDGQMEELGRRHTVVRYDVRGFGRSDMPPEPFSHRDDLRSLLDVLGLERVALLGASMGGGIAIDTTLESPARVTALIAVGAALGGSQPSAALLERWGEIDALAEAGNLGAAVELELAMWVDGPGRRRDQVDPTVRERVREMNTAIFERSLQPQGTPQPLDPPAAGRLAEIGAPTLVIVGDGDVPDMLATADRLAAGIRGARKAVIHGVAHLPNMERPAEFNRLVLEFLATL